MSLFDKTHYSPLIAKPKLDAGSHVIVDLSWPLDGSVNDYVPDSIFDCGIYFKIS